MGKKNIKEAEEQLKRVLLMMKYDSSKTLSENKMILNEESAVRKSVRAILQGCPTNPNRGTLNAGEIAAQFNKSFNYRGGFGITPWGTDDSLWREQLDIMRNGNYDDLCNIKKEFEDSGFGEFSSEIIDELSDAEMSELMVVFKGMEYKSKTSSSLGVDATSNIDINVFKRNFPCIFNSFSNDGTSVHKDTNNWAYIVIIGASGKKYNLYSDGYLYDQEKYTGKKIKCIDNNTPLPEGVTIRKKLIEKFDDSSLIQGSVSNINKGGNQTTNPPKTNRYRYCAGTSADPYMIGCMDKDQNGDIRKVQECLGGIPVDGKFWVKTEVKLKEVKGISSFTKNDVDSICNKNQTTTTTTLKPITLPTPEGGEDIHTLNQ